MKTLRTLCYVAAALSLFLSCKAEPLEGDEQAPVIEIMSPVENEEFYTIASNTAPSVLQIRAKATDNNAVTFGILTIADPNGDLADVDFDTNIKENNTVMELSSDFSTDTPGTYTLRFLFRDANGNEASTSRTVRCLHVGGDTDLAAKN
ncbi:DUF5011/hyalin repeat domain-containing protein [Sediminicola luteus]|uniref:DUF4625 domain-containing protein n=1 Tax=Sediminicola luteus TaxID=319238 RepID=A0A2A4G3H6_9FLAO|nr:hypothetical protein [Sediminicola luteus]PCE62534.1 hypothetical protein B7P33_18020 [Sediminicola luteus]